VRNLDELTAAVADFNEAGAFLAAARTAELGHEPVSP
jgi:hypothetical protein